MKRFKLSTDPQFVEKLEEIAGLYIAPPEKAVVFSVDEKSQIQALDRTQPGLPMKKGRAGTMTHDYKRNGTTTLFAALNVATGEVIDECMPRHRHDEFLVFLKKIERQTSISRAATLHRGCCPPAPRNGLEGCPRTEEQGQTGTGIGAHFTEAFKADVVVLCRASGKSIGEVWREARGLPGVAMTAIVNDVVLLELG